jgi:hypothetical protein
MLNTNSLHDGPGRVFFREMAGSAVALDELVLS